ncbi:calcium/sodium antiporter [Oceanisphaera sp. W20_SRM_FM3]|uniref:calcium/sodium antiporter n=1 Tax=Oceanisphaera sp. W20_SRM_FM3 TaxID=3240267 RepID=UPI003F9B9AC9
MPTLPTERQNRAHPAGTGAVILFEVYMAILLFLAGLVLLVVGAEVLVKGASRLAGSFGISPLVIGLTVVAFGTSAPELAVSIKAALSDQASIAVGNVVGSNIFNVLFILGLSALIVPLVVAQQLIRLDVPLMVAVSGLVLFFALDQRLSPLEGGVLFAGLLAYIGWLLYQSRRESAAVKAEYAGEFSTEPEPQAKPLLNIALVLGGLLLLVLGARWLVESAVTFAEHLGVSSSIIGLTIVAAGTSLPEVVTSLIAALRGERDIAVGNVVGSNIFNLMGVLGLTSMIAPGGIEVSSAVIGFDLPVMVAVAFACLPIFFTGGTISRKEGALLLGYYVAYTLYLILLSSHHSAQAGFSIVMLFFVIPITALTLLLVTLREWRKKQHRQLD